MDGDGATSPPGWWPLRLRPSFVLLLLTLAVILLFLGLMLASTGGHFVPQVVDVYLVCQYARAMAEGHPFQYNPGEPASTGATSLLHTALLALAHALGARGEMLVAFAILAGACFFAASVALAVRIGRRLGGEREGHLAAALVALGGPVVWGFLYGSDIALFMLLALWLLERWLAEWEQKIPHGTLAAAALLALSRPEGLPIAVFLGAAWSLAHPRRDTAGRAGSIARLILWVPTAAGLAVSALYRLKTGLWFGTSFADKSLFANYGFADGLGLVAQYGIDVLRGLLLGFYPPESAIGFSRGWASLAFPPLGLILLVVVWVRPPSGAARPLRLWLGLVGLVWALVAPSTFMGVHFNRYLMWAFPGLLALVAAGLGILTRLLARDNEDLARQWFAGAAGLLVVLGALSTARFASLYAEMAGAIARRDVAAAAWIATHLPPGVAIANAATSIEYLTGHRSLNLHGVTSPAFFGTRTAEREAGLWEALSRLAPEERPALLLTSVSAQESQVTLREVADGAPLFQTTSLSDELQIFRMRYDLVGKSRRFYLAQSLRATEGLQEVDRLNVCDARDEESHDYRFESHLGGLPLNGTARIDTYGQPDGPPEVVMDGGRAILGRESFSVATRGGKDLVVILRTARAMGVNVLRASGTGQYPLELSEAGFVVEADGQTVQRARFQPREGWEEYSFRVPSASVKEGRTALVLSGRYASFYYWFFQ